MDCILFIILHFGFITASERNCKDCHKVICGMDSILFIILHFGFYVTASERDCGD